MASEPSVAQLVAGLQAQLPTATIIGIAQNQTPIGDTTLVDVVALTLQIDGHPEPIEVRAPFNDLHSGYLVVSLNAYVENILRIYGLGEGGPATIVPPPGSDQPPGPTIEPGPVTP